MIKVESVHKQYHLGKRMVNALNGVSLQVDSGSFVAISGPSGSGKSTLLHLIGCLDVPTAGTVELMGQRTDAMSENKQAALRNRLIGFIFQSFNLIPVLTAFENIEYPLLLQNIPKRERHNRVNKVLEEVGLSSHAIHRPDYLSGGQRQRVAIARALVTEPKVVLADEPTANLDSKTGTEILDLMKTISVDHGTSFIFSTHDHKVTEYADKVYVLKDGVLC